MSLSLKLRNKLEILGIRFKYGKSAEFLAKKYNLQNLIGARKAERIIEEKYKNEPQILKIINKKIKETRPPWFVRNINLSSFNSNKGYASTFSEECIEDMAIGTILYLGGDLKDDFTDNYLEDLLSQEESFSNILSLLKDENNLLKLQHKSKDSFIIAKATASLLEEGSSRLKNRSERAFKEYVEKKENRLDPIQAKDFFYRFCLRKGRIEEVRKNLTSLEKILETQRKLGEIGATWARVSHILSGGEEKFLDSLGNFYLYVTSWLNLAGDDLKEIEKDFYPDKKSKIGIENPANVLALSMVADGYNFLSLNELKNYLRKNSQKISEMFNFYWDNLMEEYDKLVFSPYEDLFHVINLATEIVNREIKNLERKFKVSIKL